METVVSSEMSWNSKNVSLSKRKSCSSRSQEFEFFGMMISLSQYRNWLKKCLLHQLYILCKIWRRKLVPHRLSEWKRVYHHRHFNSYQIFFFNSFLWNIISKDENPVHCNNLKHWKSCVYKIKPIASMVKIEIFLKEVIALLCLVEY